MRQNLAIFANDMKHLKIKELLLSYGYLSSIQDSMNQPLDHPLTVEAIERYRYMMSAPDHLTYEELFAIPRCGCPDYGPDATGSGAWPVGCSPKWPKNHAISYQVNKSGMPSYLAPVFEDAWALMTAAYADIGLVVLREDDNPRANSLVTWQRGSGWIGLAIVPQNPRCGQRIWAKFDNRYGISLSMPSLLYQWARLLAHEIGHNNCLGHSRGGIMNPSIIGGVFTPTAWRGDPSFPKLERFYSGEPVAPAVPPSAPEWGIYPGGENQ